MNSIVKDDLVGKTVGELATENTMFFTTGLTEEKIDKPMIIQDEDSPYSMAVDPDANLVLGFFEGELSVAVKLNNIQHASVNHKRGSIEVRNKEISHEFKLRR